MKRVPKAVFFIVAILILLLTYTSIFGVYGQNGDNKITYIKGAGDIRWGIDIRGGVEASFVPADGVDATEEQLTSVEETIKLRLLSNNVTDYELYSDPANDRIIVRFPWRSDETDFDPQTAIEELAATAELTFRPGMEYESQSLDADGNVVYNTPTGETADEVILDGSDIVSAQAGYITNEQTGQPEYVVNLEFTEKGTEKFAEATSGGHGAGQPDQCRRTALCAGHCQLWHHQPHIGRIFPQRYDDCRRNRLYPGGAVYAGYVPPAGLCGDHCPDGSGSPVLCGNFRLLPGPVQLYHDVARYRRYDSLHRYGR